MKKRTVIDVLVHRGKKSSGRPRSFVESSFFSIDTEREREREAAGGYCFSGYCICVFESAFVGVCVCAYNDVVGLMFNTVARMLSERAVFAKLISTLVLQKEHFHRRRDRGFLFSIENLDMKEMPLRKMQVGNSSGISWLPHFCRIFLFHVQVYVLHKVSGARRKGYTQSFTMINT